METTREQKIAAARTYIGRCTTWAREASSIHDARKSLCTQSGDPQLASWWASRDKFIKEQRTFFNQAEFNIEIRPYQVDHPKFQQTYKATAEQIAGYRKANAEIEKFGMPECLWQFVEQRIGGDPDNAGTARLPSGLTGNDQELVQHDFCHAALAMHAILSGLTPQRQAAHLHEVARGPEGPARDLAHHFIESSGALPLQELLQMFVSGIPPERFTKGPDGKVVTPLRLDPPGATPAASATTSAIASRPSPAAEPTQSTVVSSNDDAKALAQQEWAAMGPDAQADWVDESTFVAFRSYELLGRVRGGNPQPRQSAPSFSSHSPRPVTSSTPAGEASPASQKPLTPEKAQAAGEWDGGKVDRSAWISRDVYISYRAGELRSEARKR